MKLNVCWMYHDIMDLYGDRGNIMAVSYKHMTLPTTSRV